VRFQNTVLSVTWDTSLRHVALLLIRGLWPSVEMVTVYIQLPCNWIYKE